jgi:hypothetical protein
MFGGEGASMFQIRFHPRAQARLGAPVRVSAEEAARP